MASTGTASIQRKLQDNTSRIRERIAQACERGNRDPQSVKLIAVTKSVEVDVIRMLLDQGIADLAESRVQQLSRRASMVRESAKRRRILRAGTQAATPTWHMVGHLQRNKVKSVLQWSNVIHSMDSLRLAEEISVECAERDRPVDVLLQVNVVGEKNKYGIVVGATEVIAEQVRALPGLRLIGLMTMAPLVDDPEQARAVFRRLRELAEDLKTQELLAEDGSELSMGMSNDFEVAIEEGATMVRIGTALFEGLHPSEC